MNWQKEREKEERDPRRSEYYLLKTVLLKTIASWSENEKPKKPAEDKIIALEEEAGLLSARLAAVESWIRKVSQSAVINL